MRGLREHSYIFTMTITHTEEIEIVLDIITLLPTVNVKFPCLLTAIIIKKEGLTTRFDPPPNGLRELKLHRSSTNGCTKTKMFLKIFFAIRFRS